MITNCFGARLQQAALAQALLLPLLCLPSVLNAHGNEHGVPDGGAKDPLLSPTSFNADSGTRSSSQRLAVPVVSAAQGGLWSEVEPWPLVAVHAALLPNGKVLAWDATPDDADDDPHTTDNYTTRVTLWDPITGTHVETNNDTDTDLFCAGSAHLWDGRVLFAGGDSGTAGDNGPLSNTNIYDPETNTWRRAPNMLAPRWYSSVAALGNGEMLTFGGGYLPTPAGEVFQFDQTWRGLPITNPSPYLEDYQWLQATPDGDVLTFGPGNSVSVIETEGSGSFRPGPQRDNIDLRDYGSYAMFDVGRILVAGGGESTNSSVVISTDTRQTSDTSSLNVGRRQHNLTILADGSVLATGGNTDGTRYVSATGGTKVVERWDPASGRWDVMNPMFADRQYHSVAMLLPDGRVLSAGGGICGDCYAIGYEEMNSEIYSPPYLFAPDGSLAVRPRLSSVPDQVNYAQSVVMGVSDANSIDRMHLIKLGSVTHSQNQEQRLVPLEFEKFSGAVSVTFPSSRYVAPPGHYLLYAVNNDGVPSLGATVRVGHPRPLVGETVRHDLGANSTESFEYQLSAGRFRVIVDNINPVTLMFGQSPARSVGNENLSICEPVVANGQSVCEFTVPSSGIWYLSQQTTQRVSYQFSTQAIPVASGLTPYEPPSEGPTGQPSEQAPSTPAPVTPSVPEGNNAESPVVVGSPAPDIPVQSVTVGAFSWYGMAVLWGMLVLGRRYSVGILQS